MQGEDESEKSEEARDCGAKCLACFRCCFVFILFPFVFPLALIAGLVWLILLAGMSK